VTTGSNVTNARAFVVSEGNGWYRAHLVARKSGSQTTMYAIAGAATGDGGASYAGTASAKAIYLWRGAMAVSAVPFIPSQTTSAAVSASSQVGSAINVKGWPASISGVLRAFDPVQVGNQLTFLTADLDSDAAGCGVMRVSPPVRAALADNSPVIVNTPMALMRLAGDISWPTTPGRFSGVELPLVEAVE
jgi:hypothetical protein